MAHIVISSKGTMGDFVPFVALGKRLRQRGHRVVLAVNPAMLPLAEKAGLEALPCGRPIGAGEARRWADSWDFWNPPPNETLPNRLELYDLESDYHDLSAACRGADLLVASLIQTAATLVHTRYGIPWITVVSSPGVLRHEIHVPTAPPTPDDCPEEISQAYVDFLAYINRTRTRLDFPEITEEEWGKINLSPRRVLLASSVSFSRPLAEDYPSLRLTGFWFDDTSTPWTPPADLRAFMESEPRPLVLTYSSLPVVDPARVVAVHVAAAAQVGRRLLIQRGWADLGPERWTGTNLPDHVFWADDIPHTWLFPRAAAVLHHGGLGTTAQALRCGCPTVVEPYGNDQFFTAWRTVILGIGAAMHPHEMTAPGLARMLQERVLTPRCQARAKEMAEKVRTGDGLTTACELIEAELSKR